MFLSWRQLKAGIAWQYFMIYTKHILKGEIYIRSLLTPIVISIQALFQLGFAWEPACPFFIAF